MASASGSRAGLITTTAVLAIVAVTSLVLVFIFRSDALKAEQSRVALVTKYNDVLRENDFLGDTVKALRARRDDGTDRFTKNELLLNVATGERDDLAKLVGGQTAQSAQLAATEALTQASDVLKSIGQTEVNTSADMAGTVKVLTDSVRRLADKVKEKEEVAKSASTSKDEVVVNAEKQRKTDDESIAKIRTEAATETDTAAKDRAAQQQAIKDINAAIEESNKRYATEKQALDIKAKDLELKRAALEKENSTLRAKLAAFRPDTQQSVIRQADGSVSRVSDLKTVYIDLGAGHQIVPGMTFEVYAKADGVPALKADDTSLPAGKASIEVLRVLPYTSECRIIKTAPGRTIAEGDVIANLIYDRNAKLNFVVFGSFDITTPGTPKEEDRKVVTRLIKAWGGSLQEDVSKIGPNTDFLVIGAEPKAINLAPDQQGDAILISERKKRDQEIEEYNNVIRKAQELNIPILNQNRFLYYVGYYEQASK